MSDKPTSYKATLRLTISPNEGGRVKGCLSVTGDDGYISTTELTQEQAKAEDLECKEEADAACDGLRYKYGNHNFFTVEGPLTFSDKDEFETFSINRDG